MLGEIFNSTRMSIKSLIVAISAGLLCFNALAQTRDIGIQAGIYLPMTQKTGIGSDITFGVGYGQFFHSGLGFRTGLQYTANIADIDDVFGVPVAFAYRTRSRSAEERFRSGAAGAIDATAYGSYADGNDTSRRLLGGFLLNLFRDVEFFAGVTPGYVAGSSGSPFISSRGSQYREDIRVEKKYAFSMTLDAGVSLNYSIWRFDLKFTPTIHYNLTDNYIYHSTISGTSVGTTVDQATPLRWFVSLNAGIAFRF
jgi:hypothetical protein